MIKILIFAFSVFILSCSSVQTDAVLINESSSEIRIKQGCTKKYSIRSQLSTGYKWTADKVPAVIEVVAQDEIITEASGNAGGYDYQIFMIKGNTKGTGVLIMNYYQPWKKDDNPFKTLKLNVIVE